VRATSFLISTLLLSVPLTSLAKVRPGASKRSPILTGTYSLRGRGDSGAILRVNQFSAHQIEFEMECRRGAPSYNTGAVRGTIDVIDGIAIYSVGEFGGPCKFKFNFKGSSVVISQTGGDLACGLGQGVSCAGTYRLIDRRPPKIRKDPN
jgi:hypothetical protein